MRFICFKFFGLFLFIAVLSVKAQSVYQKKFSNFIEFQQSCYAASDSSMILAGMYWESATEYDFYVSKINSEGKTLWSKSFPAAGNDYLSAVSTALNGDIFLSGYKLNDSSDFDYTSMKLTADGTLQWYKRMTGNTSMEVPIFAGSAQNGEIILVGNRETDHEPWIIKTDAGGKILWSRLLQVASGTAKVYATVACFNQQNNILVGGVTQGNLFITEINPDGQIINTKGYALPQDRSIKITSLKQTQDGGLLISCEAQQCLASGCKKYFTFYRIQANGQLAWARQISNFLGECKNTAETSDGGFLFTGWVMDSLYGKIAVVKTDGQGKISWTKLYSNTDVNGEGYFISSSANTIRFCGIEGSDPIIYKINLNGIPACTSLSIPALLGSSPLGNLNNLNLISSQSSDSSFALPCSITNTSLPDSILCQSTVSVNEIRANTVEISIFPHPVQELSTILLKQSGEQQEFSFQLFDVHGKQVLIQQFNNKQLQFNRAGIPAGIYFYSIQHQHQRIRSGKIIID